MAQSAITKVVIYGYDSQQTEDAAKAARKHFKRVEVDHLGSGADYRTFSGVLLAPMNDENFSEEQRVAFKETSESKYGCCPVSAHFKADMDDAAWQALVEELNHKHKQVMESIETIFKQLDKDNSGFLERAELKMVIADLGLKMEESDVDNMIKDLDTNHDGKISMDEFAVWWLGGRRGLTGTMRKLIGAQLRATKFLDSCGKEVADMIAAAQSQEDSTKESHFKFSVNGGAGDAGFQAMVKVFQYGTEAKVIQDAISSRLNEPANDKAGYMSVTVELKEEFVASGIPQKAIDTGVKMANENMPFAKVCSSWDGNKVTISGSAQVPQLDMVAGFLSTFKGIGVQQEMSTEFRTSSSLNEIFAEDSPPLINHLVKGLALKSQTQFWSQFKDVLMKLMESDNPMMNPQLMMGILFPYALTVKGDFDVGLDQDAVNAFMESPMGQMAAINAHQLISGMARFGADFDEAAFDEDNWKKPFPDSITAENLLEKFAECSVQEMAELCSGKQAMRYMIGRFLGDEINFEGCAAGVGMRGLVRSEGLNWLGKLWFLLQ